MSHTKTDLTPSKTLALACDLINIESITPNDNGCQTILNKRLEALGFTIEDLSCDGIRSTWAVLGTEGPLFVFSGHTDVVPAGDAALWRTPPFKATIREGNLYGRGAADMKSAIAAMLVAVERFLSQHTPKARIAFMLTSDEEGDGLGTQYVVNTLIRRKVKIDWCLIGEASSEEVLGDAIKVGRRGSLHGHLRVIGKQGHIAYPQKAENPIHRSFKALEDLTHETWDEGNAYFSPTAFQIYNINADTGASNIIPGGLNARFNFRFAPTSTAETLKSKVISVLDRYGLHYEINWQLCGEPFLSPDGALRTACLNAIKTICNITCQPNTTGGTSDGRFIAKMGSEIVELGVTSDSIHQVNEHVSLSNLEQLTELYNAILEKLCL